MKQGQVYILHCSDESLYTGMSSQLEPRIADHQEGLFFGYTHSRCPVKLLWNSDHLLIQDAILLEKNIMSWSRKKKLALITEDWNTLHLLAECRNDSHHKNISLCGACTERSRSARDDGPTTSLIREHDGSDDKEN